MCGIVGIVGSPPGDQATIEEMVATLHHRGPDDRGVWTSPDAHLGHTRLAILDLSPAGHQPMEHDDLVLTYNGEIYNFRELRSELDGPFRSESDTEVLLRLLSSDGLRCVRRLRGMFAFAAWDRRRRRLIAARDPLGIKPFYYRELDGGLAFASEAKALSRYCDSIKEFPAGAVFDSATGLHRYYDIPDGSPVAWNEADAVAALKETIEQAVVKRLRSDVPFGALLSGGLDSSIIAALAAKHVDNLKTFAVGFEGSADLAAARRVARHIGSDHRELILKPDEVVQALPEILYHLESFDQDLVRSAVPCYFVSKLAADHVKVVLTGEGADELFAGYRYHRDIVDPDALRDELRGSVARMHNINLQRVDRMSMAHGLEARVPFLDREVIALGLSLPVEMRLWRKQDGVVEKWILRKAFEDLLPREIVWRTKLQFDEGSGTAGFLAAALGAEQDDATPPHPNGRSAEEASYRKILADQYDSPQPILDLVAHWNPQLHA
ncbi:MAG: asparagine synthase B [Acidobacteria bacterium]|nr:asparagine synthase B [Acidobacteriota bacterium]